MSATVEISISIRLDPNSNGGHGISRNAESISDQIFYVTSGTVEDAMCAAIDALDESKRQCEKRAEA